MTNKPKRNSQLILGIGFLCLGVLLVVVGWLIPSRFKSIPYDVLKEAGVGTETLLEVAEDFASDGNLGAGRLLKEAGEKLALVDFDSLGFQLDQLGSSNAAVEKWGVWDPFLDAALSDISLDSYADQPGALGIVLSRSCREAMQGLLENSRNPLVGAVIETGRNTSYKRLFPVQSSSGRPLEATLLVVGLLAQGDHLTDGVRRELRERLYALSQTGDVGKLEDFYIDMLSLARLYDWGQLKPLAAKAHDLKTYSQLRYTLHRKADQQVELYAMLMLVDDAAPVMDFLGEFGDDGFATLVEAMKLGSGSLELLLREKLPVEGMDNPQESSAVVSSFAAFSLKNPQLSLAGKYGLFFLGSFVAFVGASKFGRFYTEAAVGSLALVQRFFGAFASVMVLIVLSEPYLAQGADSLGYSFKFSMPVLAEVAGETIIVDTEPKSSMGTSTILSVAFFLLLQVLVFLICMLKVRQIDRRDVDSLVKLKLMENEENLFDTGLYVGIAGTCISLVLQQLGLIEANLVSAYSSNLFGILGVAIVKIHLVRPFKNKLIMASEEQIAALAKSAQNKL